MKAERQINSLVELEALAREVVGELAVGPEATVVALSGNLGSGKTAFTQAVAKVLGVSDPVTSPTFVIEKIYELPAGPFQHLIHIDCYRLHDKTELEKLGWQELIKEPRNLILIEWPEQVGDLVVPTVTLQFTFINETTRAVTIHHG